MSTEHPLSSVNLTFIGGGNMARCLVGGALDAGVPATRIRVGERSADQRARLAAEFGVECVEDNRAAVANADIVIVAVKPQAAADAARSFADALPSGAVVVSIMAGIRIRDLRRWLGAGPTVVRAMPNTPALVHMGITVLCGDAGLAPEARVRAEALLSTAGAVTWIDDEALLDAVTAVSGSGPAYAFLVIEALATGGVDAGLPPALARTLAIHTVRGAAEMALATGTDPAELRRQVTSPGGTTAAALQVLENDGLREAFTRAVAAATARGRELADEFGSA